MIPADNKNTIHFKQRLLPNYLPHDLEIVTVNGGEGTSQYHTELPVAKFTGKRKIIPSGYFIATPRKVSFVRNNSHVLCKLLDIYVWQVNRRVLLGTCHMGLTVNEAADAATYVIRKMLHMSV